MHCVLYLKTQRVMNGMLDYEQTRPVVKDMRLDAIGGFFLPLIYQSLIRLTGIVVILLGFAEIFQLLVVC